jgi:tetratricopeptide (TPR) repeat protein
MRKNPLKTTSGILMIPAFILLCVPFTAAQVSQPRVPLRSPGWHPKDASWTRKNWTGDEEPFQKLRREIETARDLGDTELRRLYRHYESLAQKDPKNAVLQYAWAYSLYSFNEKLPNANAAAAAASLEAVKSRTFESTRLRFLLESRYFNPLKFAEEFGELGERLLTQEPDSRILMIWTNHYLRYSKSEKKRDRALTIARELVKRYPKDWDMHARLADTYDSRWIRTHNPEDVQNAIKEYKEVLRLYPNHPKKDFIKGTRIPNLEKAITAASPQK